ncbi:MAG: hypothetical protein K6C30_05720 [Bacteroidaceae bacterium]|nr:hypothetical protein [Bacteroidaceae bacterium]
MRKRLQNKIAGSVFTLPTMCVVTTFLWWLPQGGYSQEYLWGWLLCALTTFVVLETATRNHLLRVRSQLIPSLLLLFMGICGFLHPLQEGTIVQFLLSCSMFYFLRTCDCQRPELDTFHAYLLLSLASLLWAPLLLLVPVLLLSQGVYLFSLQRRSLGAVFWGAVTPYAFWIVITFSLESLAVADQLPLPTYLREVCSLQVFLQHLLAVVSPFTGGFYWQWVIDLAQTTDWATFWPTLGAGLQFRLFNHLPESLALLLVALFSLTGFVHYVNQSYDDKTRVRMCHYSYLLLIAVLALWILLVPQHLSVLFPLLVLVSIPSAAHFVALTHTWFTNAWCILLFLFSVVVAVVNLVPSTFNLLLSIF